MKHLIFDAGGVLVYPRRGDWITPLRAPEILGERMESLRSDAGQRAAKRLSEIWLDESRLVPGIEDERRLRRNYLAALDEAMGWRLPGDALDALADDFTDNIDRYGFFDDLKPWLNRWRGRYTLGVLSDAMPSIVVFLEEYGILSLFDAVVISTQVGATKPSPRMYQAILTALDARPEDCLFVDDRENNLRGAAAMGMGAVQMCRPEFPPAALWDGPVIHNFEELDALLASEHHP